MEVVVEIKNKFFIFINGNHGRKMISHRVITI
jgi:hypothetical protein